MAITTITNQVIHFDVDEACNCFSSTGCLLIDQTDNSSFQLTLTESTGTELVPVGDFSTGCGVDWTCGAAWTISGGEATYTAGLSNGISDGLGTLATDTYYKVSFDITASTSGQFDVLLGGNNIGASILATVGTFTTYYYLDSKTDDDINITGNSGTFTIDNVSVKVMSSPEFSIIPVSEPTSYVFARDAILHDTPSTMTEAAITRLRDTGIADIYLIDDVAQINIDWSGATLNDGCYNIEVDDVEISAVKTSICIDLQDYTCTKLLTWTNTEDAFSFKFVDQALYDTFTQQMRIEAKLWKPRYINDEEIFRYSNGNSELLYADSLKVYEFATTLLSEGMHDALRVGMLHDTFTIDGVQYIKQEGDYSPDWDKFPESPVIVEVYQAAQQTTNSFCA